MAGIIKLGVDDTDYSFLARNEKKRRRGRRLEHEGGERSERGERVDEVRIERA